MKLTKTEREVAQLYQGGMKPREIAQKLGISINTVYKALSKARRAMEETQSTTGNFLQTNNGGLFNFHTFNTTVQSAYVVNFQNAPGVGGDCRAILQKLEETLSYLKTLDARLKTLESREVRQPLRHSETDGSNGSWRHRLDEVEGSPDLLKKNVWISILRNKTLPS